MSYPRLFSKFANCLLKLKLQEQFLCVLQVHATNMESWYEAFLKEVEVALVKATSSKTLALLGDFNAHVDIDNATWRGIIGQHGDPDINMNGSSVSPIDRNIYSGQTNS